MAAIKWTKEQNQDCKIKIDSITRPRSQIQNGSTNNELGRGSF